MGSAELIDQSVGVARSAAIPEGAVPKGRERFEIISGILKRAANLVAVMAASTLAYAIYEILKMRGHLHHSAGTHNRHLDSPAGRVASDQPRHLRPAQPSHLFQVAP